MQGFMGSTLGNNTQGVWRHLRGFGVLWGSDAIFSWGWGALGGSGALWMRSHQGKVGDLSEEGYSLEIKQHSG